MPLNLAGQRVKVIPKAPIAPITTIRPITQSVNELSRSDLTFEFVFAKQATVV